MGQVKTFEIRIFVIEQSTTGFENSSHTFTKAAESENPASVDQWYSRRAR